MEARPGLFFTFIYKSLKSLHTVFSEISITALATLIALRPSWGQRSQSIPIGEFASLLDLHAVGETSELPFTFAHEC